jgi:hypothetical protein
MTTENEYPKISSAPNWTSIFTLHPELDPPGYAETLIWLEDNPYQKRKKEEEEKRKPKKEKKKIGRGQK